MSLSVDQKLDILLAKVDNLEREREFRAEMWDDFSPILKIVMNSGSEKLQKWDDEGYFKFLSEFGSVIHEVMKNYSAEDVKKLSQSVVAILDTIRTLTQDDVLFLANEAAEAIHNTDHRKPLGLRGMIKATRDDDVRRGISMMMEVLRYVGMGAKTLKSSGGTRARFTSPKTDSKQDKLAALLAPKRRTASGEVCVVGPAQGNTSQQVTACMTIEGVELDQDGFLKDHNHWTEDLANKLAQSAGIEKLSDAHWELIKYARQESLATNATPNMRKICNDCKVSAKHVFTLFPQAPAKTIAKIAGVSKPVGCI